MSSGKDDSSSADTSVEYGQKALDVQKQMYDQTREDFTPYREAGYKGLGVLSQKLGLAGDKTAGDYGSLLKAFSNDDFTKDPGYDFRLAEGQKGVDRQLAASGKYMTPEAAKALSEYNQNFASNEYNNSYNRFNTNQDSIYNRLAGITGTGQSATGSVAAAGSNYGNQASEIYQGIGNSINAANQAKANNSSSIFNSLLGAGAQVGAAYLSGGSSQAAGGGGSALRFSDVNLKENIHFIGTENGHSLYSFTYKGNSQHKFIGVMAQEVALRNPEAVFVTNSGYLCVDYAAIGVSFREVH